VENANIYKQEFETWTSTMGSDPNELSKRVSEVARRNVVLKVNQETLTRRYAILCEERDLLKKENGRCRADVGAMERAVIGRVSYLQVFKEAAEHRIAQLQDQLLHAVTKDEYEKEVRRANQLALKLRAMLEKESRAVEQAVASENLHHQNHLLGTENQQLRKRVEFAEANAARAKASLGKLGEGAPAPGTAATPAAAAAGGAGGAAARGAAAATTTTTHDAVSGIVGDLQALELVNLRQQNELLEVQLDREMTFSAELKQRNCEVQAGFNKATELQLGLQQAELELKEQLADCVHRAVYDEQREALAATRERVAELEAQVGTLRETAATASRQTRELQALQKAQLRESTSMRERLLDMEVDTDERTTIGKLHRIILGLQTSENDAVRRIEEERQQRLETAARLLKVESQLDDKAETLRRVRTDAKMAHGHLRQKLNDTRRMFAGAITLEQQERQLAVLQTAREQKQKAEAELEAARLANDEAADARATLELQNTELRELFLAMKDGKGAVKLADWHRKMVEARVSELQLARKLTRELARSKYLEQTVTECEGRIVAVQVELVKTREDCDHRQMQWEERETALEEKMEQMELEVGRKEALAQKLVRCSERDVRWNEPCAVAPISSRRWLSLSLSLFALYVALSVLPYLRVVKAERCQG
jgi:centrosomal protein CEP290